MTATIFSTIGSAWDLGGTDAPLPRHLAEWVTGSAVAPALAAANLQSMAGSAVLEALRGDRLEQLGGHASQYTTGAVARVLEPLAPVADAGGWWCSGLDPLDDWAPMAWGCFKPDAPRLADDGKALKYEHPASIATRSFWLRVPADVALRVADRFRLALPADVAADRNGEAGTFWRWWSAELALPLLLTEGAKKAAALLSAGLPAVALPGIWNGSPKGPDGRRELLEDLASVPLNGRRCWVLFDHSDKPKGRQDVADALARLGGLLRRAGAAEVLVGACPGPAKGADDALAAGLRWEALAAGLKPWRPRLQRPRLRPADRTITTRYVGQAGPLPSAAEAPLLALAVGMGGGKTDAIVAHLAPLLATGTRVVWVTHRRNLGATLAERVGLPWAEDPEAAPGSPQRQQGIVCCIDSLCPGSGLQIVPADWRGCVVVIDEVAAVLAAAVNGTGTAIAGRRVAVLETLGELMAEASQVIVADAQLQDAELAACEALVSRRALLLRSSHQPGTGRDLTLHPTRQSWHGAMAADLQARRRLWIATTAKKGSNGAAAITATAGRLWPGARVLLVDSDTANDPGHDAHHLAADPNGIAAAYDVVVATPAVAAGLSVSLRGHFAAVYGFSGGGNDPESVVQALARVRDDVPRHLSAPMRSPGGLLMVGSGDTDEATLLRQLRDHERLIVADLVAAGGWSLDRPTTGPWLQLWAELGARRNRQRLAYREAVLQLLEAEGYVIKEAASLDAVGRVLAEQVEVATKAEAEALQAAEDAAICNAKLLTDAEAAALSRRRHRTPAERAQLARWRLGQSWGLAADQRPDPELLKADRDGWSQRRRLAWLIEHHDRQRLVEHHDRAAALQLAPAGRTFAPDLARHQLGPVVRALEVLDVRQWLARSDWFTAEDAQLLALQALAVAHASGLRQILKLTPGERGTATLRRLLRLVGYRLEAKRNRGPDGRCWRYRVCPDVLPPGVDLQQLARAWVEQLQRPEVLR